MLLLGSSVFRCFELLERSFIRFRRIGQKADVSPAGVSSGSVQFGTALLGAVSSLQKCVSSGDTQTTD